MTEPLAILRQERDRLTREIEGLQAKVNAIGTLIAIYEREAGAPARTEPPKIEKLAPVTVSPLAPKRPQGRTPMASEQAARRDDALLSAIRDILKEGRQPLWGELCSRSGIPDGSMGYALGRIETQGKITRKDGIKIVGEEIAAPTQPAVHDPKPQPPRPAQPAAATIPVAKPDTSSDPAVAAWLANHKVTRPDNEPDVDQVMNEVRRTGDVVVPADDRFSHFTINHGATVDRLQLLLRANRSRTKRGMPIWDEGSVKWERPPEPENPLAAHQRNGAASAKRARGLAP